MRWLLPSRSREPSALARIGILVGGWTIATPPLLSGTTAAAVQTVIVGMTLVLLRFRRGPCGSTTGAGTATSNASVEERRLMEKQPGEIAVIGLGRMGRGIARRLLKAGIAPVVWNRSPEPRQELAKAGAIAVERLKDVPAKLKKPRVVWSMLPAGAVTEETLLGDEGFLHLLETGDIMIDGGNARYQDSVRRAKVFAEKGIYFLDIGTSGGLAGEEHGYCLMVGGELAAYEYVRPLLEAIAQPEGFAYFGPPGAGHFVKMVHNAIEYGMMQAFGEGLELIKSSPYADIDLKSLLHVWNHGSIIESFLGRTLEKELAADPELASYSGQIGYTGEATWALQEALALAVPLSVIAEALFARYRSMRDKTFANKVVAALRHGFGGHLNIERTQEASPPGL